MNDWFTVEEIDSDTYAISEYRHWEETHCYLVCGTDRAVLIDTGLGVSDIKEVVDSLTSLPVLTVTTHVHWDHIGGHKYFKNIAVFEKEYKWLAEEFPIPLQAVKHNLMCRPCDFPKGFHVEDYQIFQGEPQQLLHDRDAIELGNRRLLVMHTPGHSPGHCCFYEPERKYLYAGDLIYEGCLDAFYPTTDPRLFWQSVEKLNLIEIRKILPGHHKLHISTDIIQEIKAGFEKLNNEEKLNHGNEIFDFGKFQIHI